jgi:hypothetical protein
MVGDHNRNWFKIHFLSFMNHSCNIENIYELIYCFSLGSGKTDPEARCKREIIPLRGLYRGVGREAGQAELQSQAKTCGGWCPLHATGSLTKGAEILKCSYPQGHQQLVEPGYFQEALLAEAIRSC